MNALPREFYNYPASPSYFRMRTRTQVTNQLYSFCNYLEMEPDSGHHRWPASLSSTFLVVLTYARSSLGPLIGYSLMMVFVGFP